MRADALLVSCCWEEYHFFHFETLSFIGTSHFSFYLKFFVFWFWFIWDLTKNCLYDDAFIYFFKLLGSNLIFSCDLFNAANAMGGEAEDKLPFLTLITTIINTLLYILIIWLSLWNKSIFKYYVVCRGMFNDDQTRKRKHHQVTSI